MKVAIGAMNLCVGRGGTERAAVGLAHALLGRGHEPLILCADSGKPPAYPVHAGVRLHFPPRDFAYGRHADVRAVREFLLRERPEAFVSMQSCWTHMLWGLACLGTGIPFICSERSDPRHTEAVTWSKPGRHAVLAAADFIHELSPAHVETVPEYWRRKARVIPNAAPAFSRPPRSAAPHKPALLFLARFVESKRPLLLLEAFRLLAGDFPEWELRFRGYGRAVDAMRAFVAAHGLSARVSIARPGEDLAAEYATADIYCLPTRVEGFPNTVLEAMSCALPVVGVADCRALVPLEAARAARLSPEATPQALAAALRPLMASPEARRGMGAAGQALCATVHAPGAVYDQWESLLGEAAALRGQTQMDAFSREPFASRATLSAAARREWLFRDFGEPMPRSAAWFRARLGRLAGRLLGRLGGSHARH